LESLINLFIISIFDTAASFYLIINYLITILFSEKRGLHGVGVFTDISIEAEPKTGTVPKRKITKIRDVRRDLKLNSFKQHNKCNHYLYIVLDAPS
jgi:hypothetical protein